jgi:1-deoxy-D-xylulose-5-phosphate synthase
MFDLGYLRLLPNMVVMAPGDEADLESMLDFALSHDSPASIRYPKAPAERIEGSRAPLELGRSEVFEWGHDGMIVACGTLLGSCLKAAAKLREEGLDVGVINARFVKPLDRDLILERAAAIGLVLTVEENVLAGGFGAAVLEAIEQAGLAGVETRRLGVDDAFVGHGPSELLRRSLGLDAEGIAAAGLDLYHSRHPLAARP